MVRILLITTAVSGVIISGAIAQSEKPTGPPAEKEQSAAKEPSSASGPKFITSQGTDQLVFTKFKGSDVRGPDNERIGSVNDMLFDGTGKIVGVVIGVGGFLGIGTKNVAVDMGALDVIPADSGSTGNAASAANNPNNVRLKVAWTKDQLKAAPDFQYYKPPAGTATTSSPTTGSAPRQPAAPRPQAQ